jgi:hypothetical protein
MPSRNEAEGQFQCNFRAVFGQSEDFVAAFVDNVFYLPDRQFKFLCCLLIGQSVKQFSLYDFPVPFGISSP